MTASPVPGWYSDPADPTTHRYWDGNRWTKKTRPGGGAIVRDASARVDSSAPAARSGRRTVTIVAVVAVGVVAVVALGAALLTGDDGKSAYSSSFSSLEESSDTNGWETYASRSGSLEYLVDPSWTDISTREDEEAMYGTSEVPGTAIELAGKWMHSGSAFAGGTVFVVTSLDSGEELFTMRIEASVFASEFEKTVDDYQEVRSEARRTAANDQAWRIDFTGRFAGEPVWASLITIGRGTTAVVAYAFSIEDFDVWMGDFLAMCESIVVVHPPTNR